MPTYLDGFLQENPYNCSYLYGMQNIQYKGFSRAVYSYSAGRGGPDYYKNNLRMATNVTSDEAVFVWDLLGCSNIAGYGANITRPASDIPADGVIRNDVSDYTKVSASFAETPAWNGNDIVKCVYRSYKPSNTILSELSFSFDTMLDYYLCAPVFTKGSYNAIMTLEKMQDDSYGIITPNLARCDGGFMCLDTQDGSPFSQTDPTGGNLQTNESFSFIPFEGMQPFGSSVPVCVTGLSSFMDKSWTYHKRFDLAGYYGNLGERLNIDRAYVKTTVNINGSETNFSDYQSYSDWFVANMKNLKGDIGFKFTTDNILIDDIQGSNVCEVGFKTDNIEDLDYPTVQRLQFRNAEGLPTTRIDKAEGSTVNLYGDSYKFYLESEKLGQFTVTFAYCKSFGADVTVEVAPTGTEDFVELEMTKDPTFSDPSYGSLWKADLGNLNVYSENGWFDMRITMWNANGEQRQTLTPAFYLADHKGDSVESIAKDNTLKLIDGTIVASNGAEVTVYTLSGARVANKNLSNGIYMARSNGNSAKILVK